MGISFLILVFIILFGVIAYYSHLKQKERRQDMEALANELGWRFDPNTNRSHDSRFSQFSVFRRGHSRYAYNTLLGEISIGDKIWPVTMGDFHYKVTSGSGKNRRTRTYHLSYILLQLPFLRRCDLSIRKEGMFDKLASFIGFDDIDFESAEFSSKFHVKSSNKKFAYDVVHPRMMSYLMDRPSPAVDLDRHYCCLVDGQRCWEPGQFRSTLQWAREFFELWPEHVVEDLDSIHT